MIDPLNWLDGDKTIGEKCIEAAVRKEADMSEPRKDDLLSFDLQTMKILASRLGYRFETSADGNVERMYRPDGTLALTATKEKPS